MSNSLPTQEEVVRALGVVDTFDVDFELERRVQFLADYLRTASRRAYVLGISGGIDSMVAGALAQRAVSRLRTQGYACRFIAMRLPHGQQKDEADAARCLDVIAPDERVAVDIRPAVAAMHRSLRAAGIDLGDEAKADFLVGNIKARARMVAQYAAAGAADGLVIGTDHAAEALMGFFTKHGDGAADLLPLAGLSKRRVRAIGFAVGAPEDLVHKVPTADLESLRPQKPDEEAFGVSYEEIDDFLEGLSIRPEAQQIILRAYAASAHKRAPAAVPPAARAR